MINKSQNTITPIVMYHALSKEPQSNKYILEEKKFHDHLALLYANNYRTLLIDEYYNMIVDPHQTVPPRSIIITFDDRHESNYLIALPHLKKYNFTANYFITTDWIGKVGYMNSNQRRPWSWLISAG